MRKIFVLVIIFCLAGQPVYSNVENYDVCYTNAAEYYKVPEVLLRIISSIESGNNKYAINVGGRGYYTDNRSSAEKVIQANKYKNMDIGVMQINSWWFKRYGYEHELGLDACWNIHMGAYILSYEYKRHGDIWKAIAYYHSPKEKYQKRYVSKVYREVLKWQKASQ